jgi:hypothetical protein
VKTTSKWKEIFKLGVNIKDSWKNFMNNKHISNSFYSEVNFYEDVDTIRDQIYMKLKNYYFFPKLRKQIKFIESSNNTSLQTHMFDFLYDQQDLYDFYSNSDAQGNQDLAVLRDDIPLAHTLKKKNFLVDLNENTLEKIQKIRWYKFDDFSIDLSEENNLDLELKSLININSKETDGLVFVLNSIYLTLTHFCRYSYKFIKKFSENDYNFLKEYYQRYKAFSEAATFIDSYLENLNVLVNLIYEKINKDDAENFPKFSVLRMMLKIWHCEVTDKLNYEENIFSEKFENIYSDLLNWELMSHLNLDYQDSSLNNCKVVNEKSIYANPWGRDELCFSDNLSTISEQSTNCNSINNSLTCSLKSDSNTNKLIIVKRQENNCFNKDSNNLKYNKYEELVHKYFY